MKKYIPRKIEKTLLEYVKFFPVIGVTGPRQAGKSTLLMHLFEEDYRYVTFDDFKIVEFFYDDPEKFMETYGDKVIFDEVQKVPEIFPYIKLAVDRDRDQVGKFILTGSSQFSLMKSITESLAGRIGLLSLLPFCFDELPEEAKASVFYNGAFPELVKKGYQLKEEWFASYLETYLEKDIRLIYDIGNVRDFRKFISLLAASVSSILNLSRFANDLGVAVTTIKKWISILEASYLIFLLPGFTHNHRKNLVKSPKVYFYDNGIVSYLCGISNEELFEKGPLAGALFENFIVSEVKKGLLNTPLAHRLYFLKEQRGIEVDLLLDDPKRRTWIEIKNSSTFKKRMLEQMEKLLCDSDRGILVYRGKHFPYSGPIEILSYQDFLSEFL